MGTGLYFALGIPPMADDPDGPLRPSPTEARALVVRFGSPLYVYDLEEVERRYCRFVRAFSYRPLECHYAIVCNKNPLVVRRLCELGAGVHANTPGDAFAALVAGVPADRIVYSGTNLTRVDLEYLLERRIPLNLDSIDQLRDLAACSHRGRVGLRILIDDPQKRNRIGIDPSELDEALEVARMARISVVGLHMYAGTNTRRPSRFLTCLDRLLAVSDALPDLDYIDIGGGYGVGYRDGEPDLDVRTVGEAISERMRALSARRGRPIRLLVEPGRTLVATCGSLLATVVSVKERPARRLIGVDSTVGNIVVPSVYHGFHRVVALGSRAPDLEVPTDVCGNTTHSGDFLARDVRLPHVAPGDLLALRDVGAYAYAMSSHFLNRPRPAEVVLAGAGRVLTTRRETFEDLVALYKPVPA
jgi:diaminopimelate decarboxylase